MMCWCKKWNEGDSVDIHTRKDVQISSTNTNNVIPGLETGNVNVGKIEREREKGSSNIYQRYWAVCGESFLAIGGIAKRPGQIQSEYTWIGGGGGLEGGKRNGNGRQSDWSRRGRHFVQLFVGFDAVIRWRRLLRFYWRFYWKPALWLAKDE